MFLFGMIVSVFIIGKIDCVIFLPSIQLAFGVMTYQNTGRTEDEVYLDFLRVMNHIYEGEHKHIYILHADAKSGSNLISNIYQNYCSPKKNCATIEPRNVAWGGLTTGEMMLALMQRADQFENYKLSIDNQTNPGSSWDYFVLIGHESVSLTPLSYIENYLSSYKHGTNFVNCWRIDGYDFFGQWEENIWRIEGIVIDSFSGELIEGIPYGRNPPPNMVFFKSLQQMILSRDFIRYAVYGEDTRLLMLYLANVKTSDEMLIPTLLQRNQTFANTATCNTTLHYSHWIRPGGSWHPEYLTLEHLPLLLQLAGVEALFARKVSSSLPSAVGLLTALERVREEAFEKSGSTVAKYPLPLLSFRPEGDQSEEVALLEAHGNSTVHKLPWYDSIRFIDTMTWLWPMVKDHIQAVCGGIDLSQPPIVIRSLKQRLLPAVWILLSEGRPTHPYFLLQALDIIRHSRDKAESDNFTEMLQRHYSMPSEPPKQCSKPLACGTDGACPPRERESGAWSGAGSEAVAWLEESTDRIHTFDEFMRREKQ